jgi:hypothetical protein
MRSILVYFVGAAVALSALSVYLPSANAASMLNAEATERLKGYLLVSVQSNGLWYVSPTTGKRVHFQNEVSAWKFITANAVGISNADLQRVPQASGTQQSNASEMSDRMKGRFLIAVESHGEIWYVNPVNGSRYFLNGSQQGFETIKSLALGVAQADLETIPSEQPEPEPIVAVQRKAAKKPVRRVIQPTNTTGEYTNAQLGWDFASSMWKGYEQYAKSHGNDWPDIKWFDNVVSYNQPIYLNENGFQLDSGKNNYFVWKDFSKEWKTLYKQHFSMKRESDAAVMSIYLPKSVQTEYGLLQPGTYYFTSNRGFLTEKEYKTPSQQSQVPTTTVSMDVKAKDAKRVVEQVRAVQKALEKYRTDVKGYPVAYERALELGVNGITSLTRYNGFTHTPTTNDVVYIKDIQSGSPSTKIMYDSRYDGSSYVITVKLYGSYDGYEPGTYEFQPYTVVRIGDL